MLSSQPNMQPVRLNQQEIKKRYASIANVYDVWGKLTESKAQTRCLELAAIVNGDSVLEVAVGTGLTFSRILQRNPDGRNEGIDMTAEMLYQAEKKVKASGNQSYHLQVGSAYQLPYDANYFDVLINNYMFDLLPEEDFEQVLGEFGRVLRPGGRLVLANMARDGHWYNQLWEYVYRFQPGWLGGCRGVSLLSYLQHAGFSNTRREFISQMTFPSEIIYGERDD